MAAPTAISNSLRGWCATAMVALLLVCYWHTITGTIQIFFQTDDMAHAIFAPVIAAYIAWTQRCKWASTKIATDIRGAVLLLVAAAIAMIATLGESLTLSRLALFVSITGCILVTFGPKILRLHAFPLCLLLFTFPIPSSLYDKLTLPLQAIGSRGAEIALELLHVHVFRDANLLYLPSQILVVSQACSGVQGLITLAFFCFVYSYWNESGIWPRAALTAAALPASMIMNIIRIAATGVLGECNLRYTAGAWHTALGYLTLVTGFGLVWGAHSLLSRSAPKPIPGR